MDDVGLKLATTLRAAVCGICARKSLVTPCLRCDALIERFGRIRPVSVRVPKKKCSCCGRMMPGEDERKTCGRCRERVRHSMATLRRYDARNAKRRAERKAKLKKAAR